MNDLGVFEVLSIAKGYELTNRLSKLSDVDVLEASFVSPGKFLLIFKYEISRSEEAVAELKDKDFRFHKIEGVSPKILEGMYGLSKSVANEALLIAEFKSMGICLSECQRCLADDIDVLEIRTGRGIGGKAFFIVTGPQKSLDQSFKYLKSDLNNDLIDVQIIKDLSDKMRELF